MKTFVLAIATVAQIVVPWGLSAQQDRIRDRQHLKATTTGACVSGDDSSPSGADHGFDLANLDRTVKPCDDFVRFAVGGWLKNNPVPADRSRWGYWDKVVDHNEEILRGVLEEASMNGQAVPGSVRWQARM